VRSQNSEHACGRRLKCPAVFCSRSWRRSERRKVEEDQRRVRGETELDADGAEEAAGGEAGTHEAVAKPDALRDAAEDASR